MSDNSEGNLIDELRSMSWSSIYNGKLSSETSEYLETNGVPDIFKHLSLYLQEEFEFGQINLNQIPEHAAKLKAAVSIVLASPNLHSLLLSLVVEFQEVVQDYEEIFVINNFSTTGRKVFKYRLSELLALEKTNSGPFSQIYQRKKELVERFKIEVQSRFKIEIVPVPYSEELFGQPDNIATIQIKRTMFNLIGKPVIFIQEGREDDILEIMHELFAWHLMTDGTYKLEKNTSDHIFFLKSRKLNNIHVLDLLFSFGGSIWVMNRLKTMGKAEL